MTLTEIEVVRDEGSVVVMAGVEEPTGKTRSFVVDHRMAQQIIDVAFDGEPLEIELEPYQMLG